MNLPPEFWTYLKVVLLVALVPAIVGFVIVLAERRIMGFMQVRLGPNRVGPEGTLQGLADLVKLVTKEDITPAKAEKAVHFLAPVLSVIPALTALAVIPFGPPVRVGRTIVPLWVADVNIGLLFLLAITSIGVYGIILGGWSSNNKYALLGGLRSSAQMISYELAMGLSTIPVLLRSGTLSLVGIVENQAGWYALGRTPLALPNWGIFHWYLILPFVIFLITAFAETNRAPFDLPEAEGELVAGFHTEYSSMKWALFFLGEYMNMIVISSIAVTLFLGGWHGPGLMFGANGWLSEGPPWMGLVWYLIKLGALMFFFIWVRWTFPRLRYDQLMGFGWKVLLPAAVVNVLIASVWLFVRGGM